MSQKTIGCAVLKNIVTVYYNVLKNIVIIETLGKQLLHLLLCTTQLYYSRWNYEVATVFICRLSMI